MWILVFFDLPTETKKDKRAYQYSASNCRKTVSVCFSIPYMYVIVQAWTMQKSTSKG